MIVEDGVCKGVITNTGAIYRSKAVVLTAGTSSRGQIIIGELKYSSGANNSQPSIKLSENLLELGFELARFKQELRHVSKAHRLIIKQKSNQGTTLQTYLVLHPRRRLPLRPNSLLVNVYE